MELAYWVVVATGAVTLVVEAYRQYATPVEIHAHHRYPILKEVDLESLCTKGELVRGFLMYASLYMGAYAIILSSTEVYSVVRGASGEGSVGGVLPIVGARGTMGDLAVVEDPASAFDLGKPIFVSAAIVAAFSLGIFAPIEKVMRSYAHWVAAIPRGVYRVISGLKRINYAAIAPSVAGPLATRFEAGLAGRMQTAGEDDMARTLAATLHTIDTLQPAVLGATRDQIFTAYMPGAIDALITRCGAEYADIRTRLAEAEEPDAIQSLQLDVSLLCNNMQALFALLYIRSSKSVDVTRTSSATGRIIEHLQRDRDPIYNALAGGLFLMAFTVMIGFPLAYWATATVAPGDTGRFISFLRDTTIVGVTHNVLLFGAAASIALLTRDASIELGRWRPWTLRRIPFMRFIQHAIFPGIAAVLICALAKLVEFTLAVEAEGSFNAYVTANWQFCAMHFVFGLCIAFAVFVVSDQHKSNDAWVTVLLGLMALIPFVIWAFFVQATYLKPGLPLAIGALREVFLLSFPAVAFMVPFALLIEWSESEPTTESA